MASPRLSRNPLNAAVACAVVLVASNAPAPVASAATAGGQAPAAGRGFYVCSADTGTATPTTYVSEVMPASGRPGPIQTAFREYVTSSYHVRVPLSAPCRWSDNEAEARQKRAADLARANSVAAGWTFTGAAPAAAATPLAVSAPRAQTNQTANAAAAQVLGFCTARTPGGATFVPGEAVYFSSIFGFPDTRSNYGRFEFGEYLRKKSSIAQWSAPSCTTALDRDRGQMNAELERQVALFKTQGLSVVMTDWTRDTHAALMAELAKNPPPTASAPAPKPPPPSPAQDAFERALEAQRPRSNTPPAAAAGAGAAAAAGGSAAAQRFTFCSATGTPYRGTAQPHYYVTQIFPASSSSENQLANTFQRYLVQQHPQEGIGHSECPTGPRNTVETNRSTQITGARNNYKQPVVELNWTAQN
jgi:hypothetical protein